MKTLTAPVKALNLTSWFVISPAETGIPDYSVLEEAMETQTAILHETGNVNQLEIENLGKVDLLIQAGDIVKGGRQDRTLGADFIVPSQVGRVPIPVFCVEAGRWHKRNRESDIHFSSSSDFVSSKKLRTALGTSKSQQAVWKSVQEEQDKMGQSLGVDAASEDSPSSLLLSYEKMNNAEAIRGYLEALEGRASESTTGVIWAINGKLSHADTYATPKLFHKVWRKLLRAAAFEAVGESNQPAGESEPSSADVSKWLEESAKLHSEVESLPPRTRLLTRKTETQLRFETHDTTASAPVHISVLAQ